MARPVLLAGAALAVLAILAGAWLLGGTTSPVPPAPRPASPAAARISLYHYWDDAFGSMRDAVASEVQTCNRTRPSSRLVVTPVAHEAFKVNAPAMLAASGGSELFSWWAGWRTRDLDDRGLLAPLDAWWTAARADQRFAPGLIEQACTYRGRRCLLPLAQSYIGFFYNMAVFTEAGLAPPATWVDFLAACRSLRSRGINPIALGTSARWPAQFWFDYLLLRTAGPAYRQRVLEGELAWTEPAVVRAFTLWRELIELGAFNPNPNGSDWLEAAKLVHTRGAAMILMGTWAMDPYAAMGWQGGQDYGWFPFPAIDAGIPATTLTVVDGLILAEGACDQAALAATLDHFASPETQLTLAKASGSFAPHTGIGPERYDRLRHSIRASIGDSVAPPYDLATPPEAERIGLEAMVRFIDQPQQVATIIAVTAERLATCFAARKAAKR
jgi:ABC-type glycerol-3-phosphate transport system substrate-binding protein